MGNFTRCSEILQTEKIEPHSCAVNRSLSCHFLSVYEQQLLDVGNLNILRYSVVLPGIETVHTRQECVVSSCQTVQAAGAFPRALLSKPTHAQETGYNQKLLGNGKEMGRNLFTFFWQRDEKILHVKKFDTDVHGCGRMLTQFQSIFLLMVTRHWTSPIPNHEISKTSTVPV